LAALLVQPLAAEEVFTLDDALKDGVGYLTMQIPPDKTVLLFNIECDNTEISDYIISGMTSAIVNGAYFTLVDRKNMEALETELNFQLSGLVSDETSISVGHMTGAEIVFSGSFKNLGILYSLYIQASSVETSQILASRTYTVKKDKKLQALLKSAKLRPPRADKPRRAPGPDDWKKKRLYMGARSGISTTAYRLNPNTGAKPDGAVNFDAALQMLFCFTNSFALQTEVALLQDKVTQKSPSVTENASSLMIPVFARLAYASNIVSGGLFGGVYFTAPLGQMTVTRNGVSKSYNYTNPVGIAAGTDIGFKLGQGIIFGDVRVGGDTGFVGADGASQFQRSILFSFSVGYRIGLLNR
jgi:hypothetical protein